MTARRSNRPGSVNLERRLELRQNPPRKVEREVLTDKPPRRRLRG